MAAAEVKLKSPFITPFSKGEFFSPGIFDPSFEKEGKGEIFGWNDAGIVERTSGALVISVPCHQPLDGQEKTISPTLRRKGCAYLTRRSDGDFFANDYC